MNYGIAVKQKQSVEEKGGRGRDRKRPPQEIAQQPSIYRF
jgi:hypothetical protein